MLKEIFCDKFIESPLVFGSGLNTILGDNYSTNSIGKSTLLMIIDFVFGGNSFIENNSGAIKQLGHMTFKYKFIIKSTPFYFVRSTENSEIIGIGDAEYNIISNIQNREYTELLKTNYNLKFESTFRSAINPYSRIWKKDNYNVDKPILNFSKEAEFVSIDNLIKLFGYYNEIEQTSNRLKAQEESKKILASMVRKNFAPKVTKTEYLNNEKEIEQINNEIMNIQDNLLKFTLNVEKLSNKEMIDLKTQKNKLLEAQSTIQNKIRRLELNLETGNVKSKYFSRLSQFFENPNEKKINEIESFHNNITKILERELRATKDILEKENEVFNSRISIIDKQIDSLLANAKSPKFIVEKLYDLNERANSLIKTNKFYQQKESVNEEVKILNEKVDNLIKNILHSIETQINNELIRINKEIHSDKKKIPRLSLNRKSYKYDHSANTGTGKSYADLIEFDLAILKLTDLPIIIHDSILFKNIEDKAIDKVIEQYSNFEKQIFIALDGINKYSKKSQDFLNEKCFIHLSETRKLFNSDWR